MCSVDSAALSARYWLPSEHSTPTHLPLSMIRRAADLFVRITPLCASMNFAIACVSIPDPPLGILRAEVRIAEYAERPVIGYCGGCMLQGVPIRKARQWSLSKFSRITSH